MPGIVRSSAMSSMAWCVAPHGPASRPANGARIFTVVAVVGAVVADLLEAAHADERRHAEHERQLAGVREPGGDADQVLLADADVEVALRESAR